jgi:hypothetical protein
MKEKGTISYSSYVTNTKPTFKKGEHFEPKAKNYKKFDREKSLQRVKKAKLEM